MGSFLEKGGHPVATILKKKKCREVMGRCVVIRAACSNDRLPKVVSELCLGWLVMWPGGDGGLES